MSSIHFGITLESLLKFFRSLIKILRDFARNFESLIEKRLVAIYFFLFIINIDSWATLKEYSSQRCANKQLVIHNECHTRHRNVSQIEKKITLFVLSIGQNPKNMLYYLMRLKSSILRILLRKVTKIDRTTIGMLYYLY